LKLLTEEELEELKKKGKVNEIKRGDEVVIVAAVAGG